MGGGSKDPSKLFTYSRHDLIVPHVTQTVNIEMMDI